MKTPPPIDPSANDYRDYRQDREELSLRYYGCQFKQLARTKKHKVSSWIQRTRERKLATQEKYAMPLRDTLIDYHERTYYEDENSTIRKVDLKPGMGSSPPIVANLQNECYRTS